MKKYKRIQRIGAEMKILTENPSKHFTLNYFCEKFNASKSTISEDITMLKEIVEEFEFGKVETIAGALGGVVFVPSISKEYIKKYLEEICTTISDDSRIVPGGFVYITDLFSNPYYVDNMAKIISNHYKSTKIDYIVSIETKGIPLAIMVGKKMNAPAVIIRKGSRFTDGATVSINYISGTSENKIQSMSLAKKAIKEGSKVLIVDDFMRGGGTVKGICEMMQEFGVKVEGIAVAIESKAPEKKLVDDYLSLMILEEVKEKDKIVNISPNCELLQ